jgi:hypothetical protein
MEHKEKLPAISFELLAAVLNRLKIKIRTV